MDEPQKIPVLIIGAGPVGLALANDLGQRGIACQVIEREAAPVALPKMNFVNIRSMELCRRWGLAEDVRNAGWPEDHPLDVSYCTSLQGDEITRFQYPAQRENKVSYSPEPSQRCPQVWFDPVLEAGLKRFDEVELLRDHELVDFNENADGVLATIRNKSTGEEQQTLANYLVGTDGSGSRVREQAGIERENWGPVIPQMAIALKAKGFNAFVHQDRAAFFWIIDAEGVRGLVTPTDGEQLWRFNWNLRQGESVEDFDADNAIRTLAGADFDYDILTILPWQIRFTLAAQYRKGRIFLAGDAARTLAPTGGLGMNTGLADAADLGWKLAARLDGWGGEELLDSYDIERRAAGRLINDESLRNLGRVAMIPRLPGIASPDDAGEQLRHEAGETIQAGEFRLEFENDGAALGLQYVDSPCIEADDEAPPGDPNEYKPACVTGCRAPHFELATGQSVLDLYGDGFCLLRLGPEPPDTDALEQAALGAKMPLQVHRLEGPEIFRLYGRTLVLVRPDGIVGWRGEAVPVSSEALIDRLRGALSS